MPEYITGFQGQEFGYFKTIQCYRRKSCEFKVPYSGRDVDEGISQTVQHLDGSSLGSIRDELPTMYVHQHPGSLDPPVKFQEINEFRIALSLYFILVTLAAVIQSSLVTFTKHAKSGASP